MNIQKNNTQKLNDKPMITRRYFFKNAFSFTLASLIFAKPLMAFNLFDIIDPEGKSEKIQKAKKIVQGAGKFLSTSTDLDYQSEFAIGESLALEGFRRYGLAVNDHKLQKYVNLVGNAIALNSSRSNIPFYFVIVDSQLKNAFSCPGGIIFISSDLFKLMNDEAELAGVLAHEIEHVCQKHALQSIQRARALEGLGDIAEVTLKSKDRKNFTNAISGLQTILFDRGLDKNMEYEADRLALNLSYRTGYDPKGLIRVLKKLKSQEGQEVTIGSWFSTHPPLDSRLQKTRSEIARYPDASSMVKSQDRFLRYKRRLKV